MTHDVCAGVAQIDRPAPKSITRRVLSALDGTPANAAEIAGRCGLPRVVAARHLGGLVKRGRVQRVGYGLFVANSTGTAPPAPAQVLARPQPVRDQILAFLTEPRQAFEVAAHTGRRTATITGHMRAMLKLGLVVRVGYGRYALAGSVSAPPPAEALVRPHPVGEQVLRFLAEPRHVNDIAAHLQRSADKTRQQLLAMQHRGLVRSIQPQVFARICENEPVPSDRQGAATAP